MRKEKRLSGLLCVIALAVLAGACGKKAPAAEEALAAPMGEEKGITVSAKYSIELEATPAQEDTSMSVKTSVSVLLSEELQFLDGTMSVEAGESRVEIPVKSYGVKDASGNWTMYQFHTETNVWTYSRAEAAADLIKLDLSGERDATVQEAEKGSAVYTVTGKISLSALGIPGTEVLDKLVDISGLMLDFTAVYDKKTDTLQTITYDLADQAGQSGGTVTKIHVEVDSIESNPEPVTVPDEVTDTAAAATEEEGFDPGELYVRDEEPVVSQPEEAEAGGLSDFGTAEGGEASSSITAWISDAAKSDRTLKGHEPGDGSKTMGELVFGEGVEFNPFDIGYKILEEYGYEVDYYVMDALFQFMVSATPNELINMGGYPPEYWEMTGEHERLAWTYLYDFGCLSDEMVTGIGLPLDKIQAMKSEL